MRITLSLLVDLRINEQIRYRLKIYSVTGDYLALRLILRFISHGGYYCCWFCYVRGEHVNCKRQYRYESSMKIRTSNNYAAESRAAQKQQINIHGHLGISILEGIVDIPLPMSIIPDYLLSSGTRQSSPSEALQSLETRRANENRHRLQRTALSSLLSSKNEIDW